MRINLNDTVYELERLEPRLLLAVVDVTINPALLHQEWTGFGGSASTWRQGGAYNDPDFFNRMADDAGLTAFRIPVWYAFEQRNDNSDPNVFDWSKFDSASLASTLKFAQEMQKRGADTFLASVWTPPWWMKATAAHTYGGPLRPDMREEFAEYLAAYVIAAERDYGIRVDVMSIQNEAQFIQPFESTIYTPQQIIETMKVVRAKFDREGLTTRLMAPEELSMFNRWRWWENGFRADSEIWNSDMVWGTHFTDPAFYPHLKRTSIDSGNPMWHTEAPSKGGGSWTAAVRLSEEISGMMNFANMSAFFEWQLTDADPQYTIYSNGAKTTRWQAIKHYARWIRPGARRTDTVTSPTDFDNNKQQDAFVTSWIRSASDAQTIVLTNFYTESVTFNITINGSRTGTWNKWQSTNGVYFAPSTVSGGTHNSFSVTLPPTSMVTLYDRPTDPLPPRNLTSSRGNTINVNAPDIALTNELRRMALQSNAFKVDQLANSTTINQEFVNGRDAIFAAAASPERAVILTMQTLIDRGARVNNADNEGITPLMVAASTQQMWFSTESSDPTLPSKKVWTLLDAGANLQAKDFKGRTALHWAAMTPRWSISDPFPQDGQVTSALLTRGADKNKVDLFGKTPLMWAQQEGNYKHVENLNAWTADGVAPEILSSGFDFNARQAGLVTFDEAMSNFSGTQLGLWKLDAAGNPTTPVNVNVTRVALPGTNSRAELVPTSRLPNGFFRAALKSGQTVRDAAGNALATGQVFGDFWFLNADANRDQRVNSRDFAIFRKNFGRAGVGFSGGDFDYDGRVTMNDFRILRQNMGAFLGTPPGPGGDPPLPGADPPTPGGGGALMSIGASGGTAGDSRSGVMTGSFRGGLGAFRSGGVIELVSDDNDEEPALPK